jgi:hypothetical protein
LFREEYEAMDNGPSCGLLSITEDECKIAATSLGYSNAMKTINVGHAPYGCFVGHPGDGWKNTWFNENKNGQTGQDVYKSICKKGSGKEKFIVNTRNIKWIFWNRICI